MLSRSCNSQCKSFCLSGHRSFVVCLFLIWLWVYRRLAARIFFSHRSNVGAPLIPSTRASLLSTDPIGTRWTEDESGGVGRWETRRLLGRSSRHIYIDDTFTDKRRLLRHPTTLLVLAATFLFRRTPTTPPRSTGYAL